MRKIIALLAVIIIAISMYYDLKFGTIPAHSIPPQTENSNYYMTVKIKPGDTVLSIMEKLHENFDSMQIEQIMHDFQLLNPNADPYSLKEGTLYYFPYYD